MTEISHIGIKKGDLPVVALLMALVTAIDEVDAQQLQIQFYKRFSGYIYKAALHKFRNFRDPVYLSEEVLQATFITAFHKIKEGKFNIPLNANAADHDKIVKAWLGRIATNVAKKAVGKLIDDKIDYDQLEIPEPAYDQSEDIYGEAVTEVPNEFKIRLQEALNLLSDKEKHIVLVYADEGCIESNRHSKIKSSTLQYLCEYYKTTPEAIRQCKKRALDKIKKYCFE